MKTVKIWDKKEPINGVSADYVIQSHCIREEDEIFLVLEGDIVTCVENVKIIRSSYNLSSELTSIEVANEYIKIMEDRIKREDESVPKAEAEQQEIKSAINNLTRGLAQEKLDTIQKDKTINSLTKELAQEKLSSIQKEKVINNLTKELTSVKLDVIQLKKGVM